MATVRVWTRRLLIGLGLFVAIVVATVIYVLAAPAGAPRPFYMAVERGGAVVASDPKALEELMRRAPPRPGRGPQTLPRSDREAGK